MDKIRVLHIITRLIVGGAQENTMLTADLLDPKRFSVEIISGPQVGSEGSLIELIRDRGIPLTIEPTLVRQANPPKDMVALIRLARFIKRGCYTIVHTHSSKAGILGRWAAWLAGTPIIVHTVHGWGHHKYQHPLVRNFYIFLERLSLPVTNKLIVVSPRNIEKGIRDRIGRRQDYMVIHSGIELDRFGHPKVSREQTRTALQIPLDVPVVGTVTRLSLQKSPLDFVRAADIIAQHVPEAWFVIVGDGPLRPQVESLAIELGLTNRLILTGLRRDVPELMAAFDIFALSSLWEGLPRVLPQAMSTGLPIVATAVDGNVEAVVDGINGKLVPPGKPELLARSVVEFLRDPQLAAKMGMDGRKRATEFDVRKMVDEIAALYTRLMRQQA